MLTILRQSLGIIVTLGLVFLWQQTPMSSYTLYAFLALIVLYLAFSFKRKKFQPFGFLEGENTFVIYFIMAAIILLIFATGSLSSPVFFLLFLLGFGVIFAFEPAAAFVFLIALVLVFLPDALKDDVIGNMLRIGSVIVVSPLAFLFGRELRKEDKSKL